MKSRILWAIYLLCGVLFLIYVLIPITWDTRDSSSDGLFTITIMQPWARNAISWIPVVAAGSLLLITIWPTQLIESGHRLGAFLFAVFGFIGSLLLGIMTNLAPWTEHGELQDAKGNLYVFCDSSFLQAQTMALTKVLKLTDNTTTYKVLGTNNGDSPRSFLTIVRPSNSTESYGQLYLANEQWLLGVRYDNHCYLAYDLLNQKFYGHGDIEKFSPFLALDATTNMNAADVVKIAKLLQERSAFQDGRPTREAIEQGLNHPNPEVRKLAAEWLAITPREPARP